MAKKFHKKNPNVGRMVTVVSGAGLAVVTARSYQSVKQHRSQKTNLGKPLWSLFEDADKNNDGMLSYDELKMHIGHMIDEKKLRKIFDDCDVDKNGALDLKEFTDGFHKTRLRSINWNHMNDESKREKFEQKVAEKIQRKEEVQASRDQMKQLLTMYASQTSFEEVGEGAVSVQK